MEEYIIYLIVRNDLKMGKGKIAAQCCHAVQNLTVMNLNTTIFRKYLSGSHAKVCLKVQTEEELDKISNYCLQNNIMYYQVIDAGKTQVMAGSKTVLSVGPILRSKVPTIISQLKLL
jgi:PTH2 family peptidyl-tRNA hydrolase